jgi:hypothetical protein
LGRDEKLQQSGVEMSVVMMGEMARMIFHSTWADGGSKTTSNCSHKGLPLLLDASHMSVCLHIIGEMLLERLRV